MHFSQIIAVASGAAMVAAAPTQPVRLGADDVVLYGRGRYQIVKRSELEDLEQYRKNGTVPPKPAYLDDGFHGPADAAPAKRSESLTKRGGTTLIIPNPHSRFLGWDVLTSQVTKGAPTTITVSTGYDISNSISVGSSASFTLVKDFLESSLSIEYGQSWTSTQSQQFMAEVPAGKYGAFVTNPWTNRESGNVFEGTIGSEGTLTYYQADSFESKSYGQMEWVDGTVSLCVGDEFPLKRCLGEGTL